MKPVFLKRKKKHPSITLKTTWGPHLKNHTHNIVAMIMKQKKNKTEKLCGMKGKSRKRRQRPTKLDTRRPSEQQKQNTTTLDYNSSRLKWTKEQMYERTNERTKE